MQLQTRLELIWLFKGGGGEMCMQELPEVLEHHVLWLLGRGGKRANLRGANLRGADLEGANLAGTNLRDADLRGADLRGADLRGAILRSANLEGADLRGADLRGADLRDTNLRGADLEGAGLWDADLRDADLRGADLRDANLECADLEGANLIGADIKYCKGDGVVIKNKGGLYWSVVYTKDVLAIGCKQYIHTEWAEFTDDEIAKMDTKALEFWQANKARLIALQTEFN